MPREIHLCIPAVVVSFLTGLIFYVTRGDFMLAVIPSAVFLVVVTLHGLGRVINEQRALIAFVFIAFIIDDCSARSWLNLGSITVVLGSLLYRTFGLNGMETSAMLFTGWLILTQKRMMRAHWIRVGLLQVLLLTVLVWGVCLLSGLHGVATGGSLKTVIIQTRFMHLLPLWTFVGFAIVSHPQIGNTLLKAFTIAMIMKGFQGVFIYLTHRAFFMEADYLLNHFASALWVVAAVFWINYVMSLPLLWPQKLWRFALLGPLMVSYVINNRRTAVIGIGLSLLALGLLMPREWWKVKLKKMVVTAIILPLFVAGTWNMPKTGLGFLSNVFKSILFSDKEITDTRNIENFNLYQNMLDHPLLGVGLGKEYKEYMELPSMEAVYQRDQIIPHNGILFFWTYNGPVGMAAVGTLFAFMIAAFGKLVRRRKDDYAFFLMGVTGFFLVLEYLAYTFGDMSFTNNAAECLVGLLFGGAMRILAETRGTPGTPARAGVQISAI